MSEAGFSSSLSNLGREGLAIDDATTWWIILNHCFMRPPILKDQEVLQGKSDEWVWMKIWS